MAHMPVISLTLMSMVHRFEISQTRGNILPEQPSPLQSCPCCRKNNEAACEAVTHLCSSVFYDSGPFMPDDAAESRGLYCVMLT